MENKIPTVEETRLKYIPNGCVNIKGKGLGDGKPQKKYEDTLLDQMLIEFAKLHVEAALNEVTEKLYFRDSDGHVIRSEESNKLVLKVYPLTNIK